MISQNGNSSTVGQDGSNLSTVSADGLMPESLIQIIWRNRWIMLLATIGALALGFVYISKVTPIYTSTSRIYVEQSGPRIITEMEEGVMTQSKNYLYTHAELLKSTPILTAVLETSGVRQMQTFASVDNHIAYLKKTLDTVVGKKDDIISISFKSPYPAEAAQVVNATVDSYITFQATRKRSTSAEVLKILQNESVKRGKELTAKLKVMIDFKNENEALAFENRQGNVVIDRLERLSTVLTEAQLTTIENKSAYESTKEMVSDPVKLEQFLQAQRARGIYISTGSEKAELKSKLDELQLRLANRLRQVTRDHPVVTALESEIDHIKAQIAELDIELAQAQLAVAEQAYLTAKEREAQIAKYYEDQEREAISLRQQLADYTLLESDWEQTKKRCDILDDQIKDLNVTEDVGALNISILEVARPEIKPSEPQKGRVMAIALVMGLMLGGGLALLRAFMDQRLHSAEEISAVLGMPVLGIVPSMIRTAVFFGAPRGEAKTILVTSPAAGDGKTTLVSNLAIAMAQAGQRTLILDADFRKPKQHKIFEINHEDTGLSSVLAGTMTLAEVTRPTEVKGLELLPCGHEVPNPSEILNSDTFAKLLELITSKYDRVIIDSPPVIPVTDSQILAAVSDITLLVLRAEKSTRKTSQQARDGLLSVGAHILGVIVNDVPKKGRYGYYGGYGNYGYGHDKKEKGRP